MSDQGGPASSCALSATVSGLPRAMRAARPRQRYPLALAAAMSIYGLGALAANWPAFPGDPGLFRQGDLTAMAWFLAWTSHALGHLVNPFYTTWMNFPRGFNLLQNTQVFLLGVLTAPVTAWVGPLASVNLLLWAAFRLSAGAAYLLARQFVRWQPAAFVAGALYGFSPYMVGQGQIHVNLVFVPLPSLIMLAVAGVLRGGRRWGWTLGGLVTAQYFISAEVLATTAIVVGLVLAISALGLPHQVPSALRRSLAAAMIAVVVAAVCISSPVWVMVSGPYHHQGPAFVGGLSADLLGAVLPTSSQLFAPTWAITLGDRLMQGNMVENGSYLGPALLVFLVALLIRYRRSQWMRLCAVMVVLCYILILGPQLIVDGVNTRFPLPFSLLERLPLLDNVLTVRLSLYVDLFVALMVAVGMDLARAEWPMGNSRLEATGRSPSLGRWVARNWHWGGAGSDKRGTQPALVDTPLAVPDRTARDSPLLHIERSPERPGGDRSADLPYPSVAEVQPVLWQAAAKMRFRILGGYSLFHAGAGTASVFPAVLAPSPVHRFLWSQVTEGSPYPPGSVPTYGSGLVDELRTFLARYHVDTVLWTTVGAFPSKVRRLFVASLGPPSQVSGGVTAWYGVQFTLRHRR